MSMVRYTVILERPISEDEFRHHRGVGTAAAELFTRDLGRLLASDEARRLLGVTGHAVVARRFVSLNELPLSELGDIDANPYNYDDNPEVIP